MKPRSHRHLLPALVCLLAASGAAACAGEDTDEPVEQPASAPAQEGDAGGADGDSTAPALAPVVDTAARDQPSPEGDDRPMPVEPDGGIGDGALPPWTTGIVEESFSDRAVAEASGLRMGRDDGYDRVVIDFREGRLPGFHAEYVDSPLHECGSGRAIDPVGEGWLEVRLDPARGHTEEGQPTLQRTWEADELASVLRIYRTCDFEGSVTLVLAVDAPEPYRVFTLREPARVVIDVRH